MCENFQTVAQMDTEISNSQLINPKNFCWATKIVILERVRAWVMVFMATLNNISVISWRSVLLVEETGIPGENHRPATSHLQT